MAQSFLLGPTFVDKIRSTIERVDGTPLPGAGGTKRAAILEDNPPQQKNFRIATFDGSWNKGTSKTVTFANSGSSATATAVNLFADVNSDGDSDVNCAVAKDGSAWYLIASEC